MRNGLKAGRHFQQGLKPHVLAFTQQAFGHAQGRARILRDARRQRTGFVHQVFVRNHSGNQPAGEGCGRVERITGETHFRCPRHADHSRQKPGPAISRHDAHLDEALGESRFFGRNPNVAHASEVASGADRRAVDRSNGGNVQIVQSQRDALNAVAVLFPDRGRRDIVVEKTPHVLDVSPG